MPKSALSARALVSFCGVACLATLSCLNPISTDMVRQFHDVVPPVITITLPTPRESLDPAW